MNPDPTNPENPDVVNAMYTMMLANGFVSLMQTMDAMYAVLQIPNIEPLGELNKQDLIKGMKEFGLLIDNITLAESTRIETLMRNKLGPDFEF